MTQGAHIPYIKLNFKEVTISSAKNYGVYHATGELLEKYNLDTILKNT